MNFYLIGIIVFCLMVATAPGEAAEGDVKITFRTICFFPVRGYQALAYSKTKAVSAEIALPRLNFSEAYTYEGPPMITFSPKDSQASIVAQALIPPNLSHGLLLFLPAPEGSSQPFRVQVINDGSNSLKGGEAMFFNFSSQEVAGMLGDRKLQISPGHSMTLAAPVNANGRYPVEIRAKEEKEWRPLCRSSWFHDPSSRQLVFIFQEPTTRRTRLMSVACPLFTE